MVKRGILRRCIFKKRVSLAISLAEDTEMDSTAELIRHAWSENGNLDDSKPDVEACDWKGNSLMPCLAGAVGYLEGHYYSTDNFRRLIGDILRRAANPRKLLLLPAPCTGLRCFRGWVKQLLRLTQEFHYSIWEHHCPVQPLYLNEFRILQCITAIMHWLGHLQACGLGFQSYGEREKKFLNQPSSQRCFSVHQFICGDLENGKFTADKLRIRGNTKPVEVLVA